MEKHIIDQLLDKYAKGSISPSEKELLLTEIKNNPSLKEDMNLREDLVRSMEYLSYNNLRKTLNKIHQEEIIDARNSKKKMQWIIGILSLVGLALILYFTLTPNSTQKPSGPIHYAQNFSPYQASIGQRGKMEEIDYSFLDLYREKEYREVVQKITSMNLQKDSETYLILGISAMESEQFEVAENAYDAIIKKDDYYFIDHAIWYKALSYLKRNDSENALVLLTKLSNDPKADHYNEAREIIKQLRDQ